METSQEAYMWKTLQLAEQALSEGEFPIAALVVLDGKILSSAYTSERREQRYLVPAEFGPLLQADKLQPFPGERRDTVLYTNLEPCLMCLDAAMSFFLGKIVYALESPSDGAVQLVRTWQRQSEAFSEYRLPAIEAGLLRGESIRLFQRYTAMHEPGPMRVWAQSLAELG